MISTATRAGNQTARPAAAQPSASPAHNTVAASGGSPTTSRDPDTGAGQMDRRSPELHLRRRRRSECSVTVQPEGDRLHTPGRKARLSAS